MSTHPARSSPLLHFLGGAGTVTGSRFLLETARARVLIDCGLFQGLKDLRLRNWADFPVDPSSIDAVVLTHAHLDHCGYLPALWRQGFRGSVYATAGTRALAEIVLMDSARIQEDDAAYANREGFSKHHPALPLYDQEDARAALDCFRTVPWHESCRVADDVSLRCGYAGHILGSASLCVEIEGDEHGGLVFSGDLGRPRHPLLRPPDAPMAGRTLVVESTYGNRRHADESVADAFSAALVRTLGRGGVAVIPAFAVDRTEVVLRLLRELTDARRVPQVPIYVDSPMALAALDVYRRAISESWPELRPEVQDQLDSLMPERLVEVHGVAESRELTEQSGPAIIVSASGMATGGRVLHHLASRLFDERNSVILVGYQAAGTRGRALLQGVRTLKLLGRYVPVRSEVLDLSALSVHADSEELIEWMASAASAPEITFVVHGESAASEALREAIETRLERPAVVPRDLERVRLP